MTNKDGQEKYWTPEYINEYMNFMLNIRVFVKTITIVETDSVHVIFVQMLVWTAPMIT